MIHTPDLTITPDHQDKVKTEIELKLPGNVQLIMRSYQS